MSVREVFLRDIPKLPGDGTLRLIFAGWLEDNLDTARAEFLRVRCELMSPTLPKKRREALRVRELALLDAHGGEWC